MKYLKNKPNVNYIGSVFNKSYLNIKKLKKTTISKYIYEFDEKKITNIKNNEIIKLKQYISDFKSLL